MAIRGMSSISRIVNLVFKISGIQEQTGLVKGLMTGIQQLVRLIQIARISAMAFKLENPWLWPLLAAQVGAEVLFIKNQATTKEEVNARGR